jgi:hypothetical protein
MPAAKRARSAKRASGKRPRTLVRITDYHGHRVGIDPRRVIKIREAGIADEPKDTVFIDYASGGAFAKGTLAEIVPLFAAHIPLAALHAPNGMAIFLNADGIAAVEVDKRYAGKSVAVVTTDFENVRVPARNKIALQETVTQAERAIESARGAA